MIFFLFVLVIIISSVNAIDAHEIDENQIDNLESELAAPENDMSQKLSSPSDSADPVLKKSNDTDEAISSSELENDVVKTSAYLVLDNDADKENIYLGDYVTWILQAQNFGPDIAKNVKLYNKLPEGLKYIKHTTTKGTFDPVSGVWNIGDLRVEDGQVNLLITVKALTVGEKVNKAYITSDTLNSNNKTYEEEEIGVFSRDNSKTSGFEKHVSAKSLHETRLHETGNPVFLILVSLLILFIPSIKRK